MRKGLMRQGGRGSFFFNDTATTEIYTLSLHDALPIWAPVTTAWGELRRREVLRVTLDWGGGDHGVGEAAPLEPYDGVSLGAGDRESTRLNSSHANISYAGFCLKKITRAEPHCLTEDYN